MILLIFLPLFLFAQSYSLTQLIEHASKNNKQVKAKILQSKSALSQVDAQERDFWPTLDIGGAYSNVSPTTLISPAHTGTGYAKAGFNIYDGGRRSALLRSKNYLYSASRLEKEAFEKSMTLKIINNYYTILKLKSVLIAMKAQTKEIHAQIERMEKFKNAGLSTQVDIDKLRAEYDNNIFTIETTKFNIVSNLENLSLLSGIRANSLKENRILEPKRVTFEEYEKSKILKANANSLKENASAIDAGYMPQLRVEDQYSVSKYSDTAALPGVPSDGFLPENQNKLMLTVNMRLFDNAKMKKDKEAVMYQKLAIDSESMYAIEEQKMQFKLAKSRMKTVRARGKSARSALKAATSTYKVVLEKYEVGLVDNITYLDALNSKTLSDARYKEALYDYEISKSIFYFYAGKNIREYIR